MPVKFCVNVAEVRAALLFASNDESRFVLNGVHFELRPKAVPIIVASDGSRLAVIETQSDQNGSEPCEAKFTVNADFLKTLCAFAKKYDGLLKIEFHNPFRVVFGIGTDMVLDVEKGAVIEGDFPAWRAVIPTGEKVPVDQLGLSGDYISDFSKAGKLLGCEVPILRMNLFSSESTIEIKLDTKPNFYGVLMPVRPDDDVKGFQPEFLGMEKNTAEKVAAKA